ncbi:MAG: hypothetical protein KF730_05555 [Sphingomonas sp.]|uniref:hypothetical protein n=1 Tax=Sphingomonas sp. TaxID=28214 RepID=UPI0025E9D0A2|nr:hypothetical protein [Sphingomonas sp.]MBX3564028.1 hypothetical protein [Sphingomonas sp.]
MSNWLIAPLLLFTIQAEIAEPRVGYNSIDIIEGKAITNYRFEKDLLVSFDGKDGITIKYGTTGINIPARTPSTLISFPLSRYIILNFGDGSGQVYDILGIKLNNGEQINFEPLKRSMIQFARKNRCAIKKDEISIILVGWDKFDNILLKSEDFSRLGNCSIMNRTWKFSLSNSRYTMRN